MAYNNMYGGVGMGFSSEPTGLMPTGMFPSGGYAPGGMAVNIPDAATVNANNLAYSRGAMGSDPVYKTATGLLNPNDPTAVRDVMQGGAEHAVGTGMVGSGAAGTYTGRLRQYDVERRAALGNQLLSGAYSRQPPPVNPWAQAELQMRQNQENNQLLAGIQSRYAPSGGVNFGGGGGGRSAPMMIGGGGGGGGGYAGPIQNVPRSVNIPAGGGQIAGGYGGDVWNAQNQVSQFGNSSNYAPGTMYSGANDMAIPMPTPTGGDVQQSDAGNNFWDEWDSWG